MTISRIIRSARLALPACLVLGLLLAQPLAAAVQARDSDGTLVSLPAPARRIVSLSPAATESIYAIGAGPALVGDTSFCDWPAEALALPKVGGFAASTISVERILALKPDLVVSAGAMHGVIAVALARLKIPVFVWDPGDFASIASCMESLGRLSGHGQEAGKAAAAMLASIESVRSRLAAVPREKRPTVFWEMYDDPLMTCGASTFPHAIIEAAGGRDLFSDLPGQWPRISGEEVIRRAPEWILGADDHGDKLTVEGLSGRPGWRQVPAVSQGRVALIPANLVSRASPRVAEGVLAVAAILWPGLFPKAPK